MLKTNQSSVGAEASTEAKSSTSLKEGLMESADEKLTVNLILKEKEEDVTFYLEEESNDFKRHSFTLTTHAVICETNNDFTAHFHTLVGCKMHEVGNLLELIGYRSREQSCFKNARMERFVRKIKIKASSEELARVVLIRWYAAITYILKGLPIPESLKKAGTVSEAKKIEIPEPYRLLVFINPFSGSKQSVEIWKKYASKVICEDAGLRADLIYTERQNHARDYVRGLKNLINTYDSIVIVSGDGLVFEVVQGMMNRADWAEVVRKVPVGIINGGTGNGLATSVCYESNVPIGVLSASFIIAKHQIRSLDLWAVDIKGRNEIKRVYAFLSLEWGLNSFLDIDSESLRGLGDVRFILWAILGMLLKREYKGTFSYVESERMAQTAKDISKPELYWEKHSVEKHIGMKGPFTELLPDLKDEIPSNWKKIDDTYYTMLNTNLPAISETAVCSPEIKMDDGFIQTLLLRKNGPMHVTRWTISRFLLNIESGEGFKDKPYSEIFPTRAYRLEPKDEEAHGKRYIALDGEEVEYCAHQAENLRGFLKVLSLKQPLEY